MLYVARADGPERHRGAVMRVEASPFAPSGRLLEDFGHGVVGGQGFTRRYIWELRQLWHRDRRAFLDVIDLASGGTDCMITDSYGDATHALRPILATALKQLARMRRDGVRRRERVSRARAV